LVQSGLMISRSVFGIVLPENSSDRFVYTSQAIIAHKFNNFFALGLGARYKLGGHVSLFSEFYYLTNSVDNTTSRYNPFFLGVNWEIGYVNFQLSLSNVKNFDETAAILFTPTNFNFNDGRLHFGVNVNYVIHTRKKKKK